MVTWWGYIISHLLQADTCSLDQSLQSGDSFILSQQVGVEGRGQVPVTIIGDRINWSEARVLRLAVRGVNIPLW